jgi:RND family efflux transporter MFP subunit
MHNSPSPDSRHKPMIPHTLRLLLIILMVGGGFAVLLILGLSHRNQNHAEAIKANHNLVDTIVTVTTPHFSSSTMDLTLPGEINPYLQTFIYSRTNGTLRKRYVDIGDRVRAGQLLATVDVPELDQELLQAKASLAQAVSSAAEQKTRVDLAKISLDRWMKNSESGGVSQQDVDQRRADYNTSQAAYRVSQAVIAQQNANIHRLMALQNYKRITAPFAGVITAKNVDKGANIVSGGSSTSTNLFTIAQTHRLRVFINVPQANVDDIKIGQVANVHLAERPKAMYPGRIARTVGVVDPASRTMKTEVDLPNGQGQLSPGRFSQVTLKIAQTHPTLRISNNVLIVNEQGTHVMQVMPDKTLQYVAVTPGAITARTSRFYPA